MTASCSYISYKSTGYFSSLITDYLESTETVQPFYKHAVSYDGIIASIEERKKFDNNRQLLVDELKKQYNGIELSDTQVTNISNLADTSTFTICTAHQPNIFTGHLYFIYKILHTIKLAQELSIELPQYKFVPVFYMGSEDADLDELGHINLNGEKLVWKTSQTGAVGRMKVDKALLELIDRIEGEIAVLPYGNQITEVLRNAYRIGNTIQQATLEVVNHLFAHYGLLTIIPDNANLKRSFNPIVKRELLEEFSQPIVSETSEQLNKYYKSQASGREINLFYLVDGVRERITRNEEGFWVSRFRWSEEEILKEVDEFPERFSANVILRGLFQETILPNIAFIGGGGEIAYWLQLKRVFESANVPFPVLILRNSFLIITAEQRKKVEALGFSVEEFFKGKSELINAAVARNTTKKLNLDHEKRQLEENYRQILEIVSEIDATLQEHTLALKKRAMKKVAELEKKMLRAEKRKYESEQRQINSLKEKLFMRNSLQERIDNFSPYYALYGPSWLSNLHQASLALDQKFAIMEVQEK